MILVEEFFYLEGLLEIFLPIGPLIPAEARVKTSEAKRPNNTESQPNPDPNPRAPGKNNQKSKATRHTTIFHQHRHGALRCLCRSPIYLLETCELRGLVACV